jgi:hypothetical protein
VLRLSLSLCVKQGNQLKLKALLEPTFPDPFL